MAISVMQGEVIAPAVTCVRARITRETGRQLQFEACAPVRAGASAARTMARQLGVVGIEQSAAGFHLAAIWLQGVVIPEYARGSYRRLR